MSDIIAYAHEYMFFMPPYTRQVDIIGFVTSIIAYVFFLVLMVVVFVQRHRHIELLKRGHSISGKVEKIKIIRNRLFMSTGYCNVVVAFEWGRRTHRLKTINKIDDFRVLVGLEVDLLYLPEYPYSVILKNGVKPNSAILLVVIIVVMHIMILGVLFRW